MKKLGLLLGLLGLATYVQAQVNQEKIKQLLPGKRWGLALYVAQTPVSTDTVLNLHDCANEYLEVYANGTFASSSVPRPGTWQVLNDSTVLFRKSGGGKYMQVVVAHLSPDSLAVLDRDRRSTDVFLQTFTVCKLNDNTFVDSRTSYAITDTWGLNLGGQAFRAGFAEIGIGRGTFGRKGFVMMPALNFELAPWNNIYGLVPSVMLEDRVFTYGLGLATYFDQNGTYFRLRPMAGFTLKRLFPKAGFTAQAFYSYNVQLGESPNERLNIHALHLRIHLPFSKRTRTGRYIEGEEYEKE